MRKRKPVAFDWAALKISLNRIAKEEASSQDGTISRTPEIQRYVQFQRYVRRTARVPDPNASRDAMIKLADEFRLSQFQAKTLFETLHNLGASFRFGRGIESLERSGSYVKKLASMRKSLSMLSRFSKQLLASEPKPTDRKIMTHLENAAHRWADDVRKRNQSQQRYDVWENEAKPNGFVHRVVQSNGYPMNTYDSMSVLRTWLHNTVLFSDLIKNIIEDEHRKPKAVNLDDRNSYQTLSVADLKAQSDEPTEIVRLAGIDLPMLYERFTRKRYGFAQNADNTRSCTTGAQFVIMYFEVMGLTAPGPETLNSHWKAAKAWRGESAPKLGDR